MDASVVNPSTKTRGMRDWGGAGEPAEMEKKPGC